MSFFLDLIKIAFPNNCVSCNLPLARNERFICSNCKFYIPKGNLHISTNSDTSDLLNKSDAFLGASHLFNFDKDGKTQKLLHQVKYKSNLKLGTYLGELMGLDFKSQLRNIDYIIPVPLHQRKLHQRGYNQSELLSEGISSVINKPVSTLNLIRTRYTETQTKKKKTERIKNIKNAFEVTNPIELQDKQILLIDDVITTGSTLNECVKVLSEIQNCEIIVLVLAKSNY